ncbi:AraC family transcriptional regulator [Paenibacillus sp. J5C2022]|uniref:AraC family transcriptional regulator n=1 Tax=Paenibacillus sp. J5C2022 TaxID=2977129 RepID=UPI0021CF97AE|nr:AraC family transcriptional regulator [Paenibacillus sp. J5C2022]
MATSRIEARPLQRGGGRIKVMAAALLIAAVPVLLVGWFSYVSARDSLVREAQGYHDMVMEQIRQRSDNMMDTVERIVLQHVFDDALAVGLKEGSLLDSEHEQSQILSRLNAMEALLEHVEAVYLYVPDKDWLLTTGGIEFDPGRLLGRELHSKLIARSAPSFWQDMPRADGNSRHRLMEGLSYARGVPASFPEPLGYYVVKLKEAALYALYGDIYYENGGGMLAISPEGRLYANAGTHRFVEEHVDPARLHTWLEAVKPGADGASVIENVGGQGLLVNAVQSDRSDWIYVSVSPIADMTKRVRAFAEAVLMYTLLFAILAAGAMAFLSTNVYARFRTSLQHLQQRNSALEHEVRSTLEWQKGYLLSKWLQEPLNEQERRLMMNAGIPTTEGSGYTAICIVVYALGTASHGAGIAEGSAERWLKRLAADRGSDADRFRFARLGADMVGGVYMYLGNDADDPHQSIVEWGERLVGEAEAGMLVIGVGSARSYGELYLSFEEARKALQRKIADSGQYLFIYSDERHAQEHYIYPIEQEKVIVAHLKLGEHEKAVGALQAFTAAMHTADQLDEAQIVQVYAMLLASVLRVLFEGNSLPVAVLFRYNLYERLAGCRSVREIEGWLSDEVFQQIASHVLECRKAREDVMDASVIMAMEYVQKHYDQDISLGLLADMLGISELQLSLAFKREVGLTYTDYVIALRIDKAKELLRRTDMKVAEIAERMRYNNAQNFIRMFKRVEGMTPGEYRRISVGSDGVQG